MTLPWHQAIFHRDELRAARYAALADAEGFLQVCFALEALGLQLSKRQENLGKYGAVLRELASASTVLSEMSGTAPEYFSSFDALYETVRRARNDAMHTGAYARHATVAAIELCIGLEEALMSDSQGRRPLVKDLMVKSPIVVEEWQPVAFARQLMLTHSFTYLPMSIEGQWKLVSELALARYLCDAGRRSKKLGLWIKDAGDKLRLIDAPIAKLDQRADELIEQLADSSPTIWVVLDRERAICGVLTPFELM